MKHRARALARFARIWSYSTVPGTDSYDGYGSFMLVCQHSILLRAKGLPAFRYSKYICTNIKSWKIACLSLRCNIKCLFWKISQGQQGQILVLISGTSLQSILCCFHAARWQFTLQYATDWQAPQRSFGDFFLQLPHAAHMSSSSSVNSCFAAG